MKIKVSQLRILLISLLATLLGVGIISLFLIRQGAVKNLGKITITDEIARIRLSADLKQQQFLYTQLIERVGPRQAQEDLYRSGMSFDGQTHLLDHTVGDWLYKKYGGKGVIYCTDYFLSACYHGLIVPFIAKEGVNNLDKVMQECRKVNSGTVGQCAHGIGHGLLAWEGYANLPKALLQCDTVASLSKNFPVFNCYDGVFMENNWAVHNDGTPSPDRWVKADDPTFPCFDSRIDEKYRRACWSNQPQVMFKLFAGNVMPIADECLKLTNIDYQYTCFDAIARQLHPMTKGSVSEVFRLCSQMPGIWETKCILSNAYAYFSVGDRIIPYKICAALLQDDNKRTCFSGIQHEFHAYARSKVEIASLCNAIPKEYKIAQCLQ